MRGSFAQRSVKVRCLALWFLRCCLSVTVISLTLCISHIFCSRIRVFIFCPKEFLSITAGLGFSSGSVVKNPPALQELQDTLVLFLGLEGPLKEEMVTNSGILA